MTAKLDELIKIASAATPGKWIRDKQGCISSMAKWVSDGCLVEVTDEPENFRREEDLSHVITFNPAVMLPMLHAMKGMMATLEEVSDTWEWCDDMQKMKRTKEAELAVEALAAARKAVGHE